MRTPSSISFINGQSGALHGTIALAAAACFALSLSDRPAMADTTTGAATPQPSTAGASLSTGNLIDRVVATVNGEIVTLSETREAAWGLSERRNAVSDDDARALAAALDHIIDRRLMAQAARKLKIEPDEEAIERSVNETIQETRQQLGSEAAFQRFLESRGIAMETLRSTLRRRETESQLSRRALMRRVHVTREAIEAFERERRKAGEETDFLFLDRILIAVPESADRETELAARQRAVSLVSQIQRGEDFAQMARRWSDDPNVARTDGALGWVEARSLKAPIREALASLDSGEVSAPIRADEGFQILRLRARRDAGSLLYEKTAREAQRKWIEELRAKAIIEYIPATPNATADSPKREETNAP